MERTCDVCAMEFTSSAPNEAVADVCLGGPWGYVCDAHLSNGSTGTFFEPRPCAACGKQTKKVNKGQARCGRCNG